MLPHDSGLSGWKDESFLASPLLYGVTMSRMINAVLILLWLGGREKRMFPLIGSIELIGLLFLSALIIFPYWKIFRKAGFPTWLSLLTVIPIVDLVVLYYVGLAKWPARQK